MTLCRKIKDKCAELGITYSAFYQRITVYGWDYEKALTTPKGNNGRKPKEFYNGEPLTDVLKRIGMNYTTYWNRVHLYKWTPKRAIETPVDKRKHKKGKRNNG